MIGGADEEEDNDVGEDEGAFEAVVMMGKSNTGWIANVFLNEADCFRPDQGKHPAGQDLA